MWQIRDYPRSCLRSSGGRAVRQIKTALNAFQTVGQSVNTNREVRTRFRIVDLVPPDCQNGCMRLDLPGAQFPKVAAHGRQFGPGWLSGAQGRGFPAQPSASQAMSVRYSACMVSSGAALMP